MGFAHALSPKTDASPTLFAAALSTFVVGAYSPDDSEKPATGTNVDIVTLLKRIVDDGPIQDSEGVLRDYEDLGIPPGFPQVTPSIQRSRGPLPAGV